MVAQTETKSERERERDWYIPARDDDRRSCLAKGSACYIAAETRNGMEKREEEKRQKGASSRHVSRHTYIIHT